MNPQKTKKSPGAHVCAPGDGRSFFRAVCFRSDQAGRPWHGPRGSEHDIVGARHGPRRDEDHALGPRLRPDARLRRVGHDQVGHEGHRDGREADSKQGADAHVVSFSDAITYLILLHNLYKKSIFTYSVLTLNC